MNTVTLTGRVGGDIEIRVGAGGGYVGRFSLAESRAAREGEGQDKHAPVWHQVVVFGTRAERLRKVVTKGRLLLVSGELGYSEWQDKQGGKHREAQVELRGSVGNIEFLDKPKGRLGGAGESESAAGEARA